jgi:hypothetical protein
MGVFCKVSVGVGWVCLNDMRVGWVCNWMLLRVRWVSGGCVVGGLLLVAPAIMACVAMWGAGWRMAS